MTSNIRTIYLSLRSIIESIRFDDEDTEKMFGKDSFKYSGVWNNQIDEAVKGKNYSFDDPAVFYEFNPGDCKLLGARVQSYPDTEIVIHIYVVLLDGGNDTMDENLLIFDIADYVRVKMINANLPFCSTLMPLSDNQDYEHNNVYHYILRYKTNYITSIGSEFDPNTTIKGYLNNPNLSINLFLEWIHCETYYSTISEGKSFYKNKVGGRYKFRGGGLYLSSDSGSDFLLANVVSYRGKIYVCKITNSDSQFNPDNWIEITFWQSNTQYDQGHILYFEGDTYIAKESNNDQVFDYSKWNKIER